MMDKSIRLQYTLEDKPEVVGLKTASVHGRKFATQRQAAQAVMDWITFYNHRRQQRQIDAFGDLFS